MTGQCWQKMSMILIQQTQTSSWLRWPLLAHREQLITVGQRWTQGLVVAVASRVTISPFFLKCWAVYRSNSWSAPQSGAATVSGKMLPNECHPNNHTYA